MGESLTLEALKFMILGMSVVFLFLSILIFLLNIQTKLINKFTPATTPTPKTSQNFTTPKKEQIVEEIEEEVVAVITAAVKKFREKKSKT